MKKNNRRKIVKIHEYRGDLKKVELDCGHFVERAVWSGRSLPKSNKLACDRCAHAEQKNERIVPRIAIELCPCGKQSGHDAGSDFFVSVVRNSGKPTQRTGLVLGPYATHGEALANVDRGRAIAERADPWTAFDAFGTVETEAGKWSGVFGV